MRLADVFVAVRADMTDFNAAMRGLDGSLRGVQQSMGSLGRSLTTNVTLPILAVGGATSKMALDFERTMGQLVGLAGVPAQEVGALREQILSLSREVGRGPQELAEAFYFVASAGFEANEAMEVLEVSSRASAVGMGDTQTIAKVLGGVINSYGKANLTAAHAADVLTKAVGEGAAEASELAAVLPQVVPSAAMLGVAFEDLLGSLSAMTVGGATASQAAVGLNRVFTALLKPSTQANEALAQVGLSAEGLRRQLAEEGTVAVLRTLNDAFDGNVESMGAVFGTVQGLRGAFSLLNLDAEQLDAIMASVADSVGAQGDAFAAIPEDVLAFDRALASLQADAIELGRDILPTVVSLFRQVAEVVRGVVGVWKSLDFETQNLIIRLALFAAAAGPVLSILSKFIAVGRGTINTFLFIGKALKALHDNVWFVSAAWEHLALAIRKPTVALGALKAAIVALALPLTAAVALLYTVAKVGEEVHKSVAPVAHTFNEIASQVGKSRQEIEGEVNRLAQATGRSADDIRRKFISLIEAGASWEQATRAIERGMAGIDWRRQQDALAETGRAWEAYQNQISGVMPRVVAEVETGMGQTVQVFEDGSTAVVGEAGEMSDDVAAQMEEMRKAAVEHVRSMIEGIRSLFTSETQLEQQVSDFVEQITNPFQDVQYAGQLLQNLMLGEIPQAFEDGSTATNQITADFVEETLRQWATLNPGLLETAEGIPPTLREGIDSNLQPLLDWLKTDVVAHMLDTMTFPEALRAAGFENLAAYVEGLERARMLELAEELARTRQQTLEEFEMEQDAKDAGHSTGAGLATGVAESQPQSEWQAKLTAAAVRRALAISLYNEGYGVGATYAQGMKAAAETEVYSGATSIANAAGGQIRIESEPPDPNSPLRGITKWGGNLVRTFAESMLGAISTAYRATSEVASAFALNPAMSGFPALATATVPAGVAPAANAPGGTIIQRQYVLNANGVQKVFASREDFIKELERMSWFEGGDPRIGPSG